MDFSEALQDNALRFSSCQRPNCWTMTAVIVVSCVIFLFSLLYNWVGLARPLLICGVFQLRGRIFGFVFRVYVSLYLMSIVRVNIVMFQFHVLFVHKAVYDFIKCYT